MLIPDSSGKVKSLRIPHWVFHAAACAVMTAAAIIIITSTQAGYLGQQLDQSSIQLNETLKEKQEIETTFKEEKSNLASSFQREKEALLNEREGFENKINDFETKVEKLQQKIQEIDQIKSEIYGKIGDLKEIGAPIAISLGENEHAQEPMGGPHVPVNYSDSFDEILNVLSQKLDRDIEELSLLNEAADSATPFLQVCPTIWPVSGRVTSGFGVRSNPFGGSALEGHTGLDIKCSTGTKVAATGSGVVTFSGWKGGYGNIVIVNHGYGIETYYAHNSELLTEVGDKVVRGDIIALSGNTGRSTGPHCHYEVRVNDVPQNSWNYLD